MIENRSILILKKLIVRDYNNKIVYNEIYNSSVNIIRGKNSSGKSTIANFIFYITGGAFKNWSTEAQKCKDVTAEVEINGVIYTLKRAISKSMFSPMEVYWGNYEKSKQDSLTWKVFPYKMTDNSLSFSNILFNALNFPEVKGDLDSNITMHQILRLLYIDQETPPQNLFRSENFDLPLTRKTVSEILLGIYDDSLYAERIELKSKIKRLESKEKEYKNLINVVNHSEISSDRRKVEKEITNSDLELNRIDNDIEKLRTNKLRTTKKTTTSIERIKEKLIFYKNKVNDTSSKINQYGIEISDSKQFIDTLNKRVYQLNNSILTKQIIGDLTLTHCPQCLEELDNKVDEDHCKLCKKPLEEEAEKANAKRLLQEMQLQVRESSILLENKEKIYTELCDEIPLLTEKMRSHQKELDSSLKNIQSTRDERIDKLFVLKGVTENKKENLIKYLRVVELIERLKNEISELEKDKKILKLSISKKEEEQSYRFSKVMRRIKEIALEILKKDLLRQEEFKNGKVIDIDFLRDSFTLDGNNNFSASSKTYFKNSVLFSVFFASLEFDFMRFPRFILCDNMEDKGMEKERTQNFQEIITDLSKKYLKYNIDHQIIFTTSMISDELNNTKYCIGNYYNADNKTLKTD